MGFEKIVTSLLILIPPAFVILSQLLLYLIGRKVDTGELKLNEAPYVSVLVAVKNEDLETIQGLIDNIYSVRWLKDKMEIIITSGDPPEVIDRIRRSIKIPRDLRVLVIGGSGKPRKSAALQEALKYVQGEFILTLDVDARIPPESLVRLYSVMQDRGCDAVVMDWKGYTKADWSSLAKGLIIATTLGSVASIRARDKLSLNVFPLGSGTLYRTSAIVEVNGWDETMVQDDLELGARLIFHNKKICSSSIPVEVEVPYDFYSFYIQQTRWAMGSIETFIKRMRYIWRSKVSILKKIDATLFLLQYLPVSLTFLGALYLIYISIATPMSDPLNTPLIYIWFFSLAIYLFALLKIGSKLGIRTLSALSGIGRLSSYTVAISPFVFIYSLKALTKNRVFNVTPKSSSQQGSRKMGLTTVRSVIAVLGIVFLSASIHFLLYKSYLTGVWLLYYSMGYLYTTVVSFLEQRS